MCAGNSAKFTAKAQGLDADVVCLDLEDAVAASKKEEARVTVVESLNTLDFGRSEVAVRINPLMTDLCEGDLTASLMVRVGAGVGGRGKRREGGRAVPRTSTTAVCVDAGPARARRH